MSSPPAAPRETKRRRTAAQLERKRARDRESQRVCRERNRERLSTIEIELSTLSQRYESLLAFTESLQQNSSVAGSQAGRVENATGTPHSMARLTPPNMEPECSTSPPSLPVCVTEPMSGPTDVATFVSPYSPAASTAHSATTNSDHSTNQGQLVDWSSHTSLVASAYKEHRSLDSGVVAYQLHNGMGLYQTSPSSESLLHDQARSESALTSSHWLDNVNPSRLAKCVCASTHKSEQDCIERNIFAVLFKAHVDMAMEAPIEYPRSPSLANLLFLEIDSNPIVEVLGRTIRDFGPAQLSDLMAIYFVMYRLLRWRICPVTETYYDIPFWYRPSALQRSKPHPICIDLIAFPKLRDFLIEEIENFDIKTLGRDMSECLTIEWPEDQQLIVRDIKTGDTVLNPKFEERVWHFENWKMRRRWAWRQPRLAEFVTLSDKS